ncbi:MAG: serine kinase [Rubellimicrobium sp.]|nr:serine kinase [Rubellimicrobium sp.]
MPAALTLHASAVAVTGRGLLILGPSGSGKSALALQMIGQGAGLIADDRTRLTRAGDAVTLACPPDLSGLIEARGLGLLRAPAHPPAPLALVVDLGAPETARFPDPREIDLLGATFPLVGGIAAAHLGPALALFLAHGRAAP